MKSLPKKILALTLFAIAVTSLFCVQPAQAFTMTVNQVGANVVANGSGAIDLNGLTFAGNASFADNGFNPGLGIILVGPTFVTVDGFTGFTGPGSFGSGTGENPSSSTGDDFGLYLPLGELFVPGGYVSGSLLSNMMTFNGATFASLGLTPGTYVWTWGDGGANQRFTLEIGSVPDGGTTVCLLGCALLGVVVLRRRLGC
jgi:hypothetical protein